MQCVFVLFICHFVAQEEFMVNSYKNSYKTPTQNLISLSIHNAGYQKCLPTHQWGPGIRDHYLLHHVISGRGYYCLNGNTYQLSTGDTFLIFPFDEVTYYADLEDPWEYSWVGFSGTDVKTILKSTEFSHSLPVLYKIDNQQIVQQRLMQIYNARGSNLNNTVQMTGELYLLLVEFMNANLSSPIHIRSAYTLYVEKGIEYIHSNYSYPITVLDIASYVGVSRSHLFRAFQSITSQSPKAYLTQFRLKQACILLNHSDLSISAISRSVGFEDNLNFSKMFKKHMGKSPSIYRNCNYSS